MQSQRRYDGIWDMVLGDIWDLFISFSMLADQMFQWLNVWHVICYQVPLTSKSPQILSCNKWVQKKERYWAEKMLKCSQGHPGSYKMMKPNTMTERMEDVLILAQVKEPWERDLVSADIIITVADTQSILAASDKIIKRTSLKLKTANSIYISSGLPEEGLHLTTEWESIVELLWALWDLRSQQNTWGNSIKWNRVTELRN